MQVIESLNEMQSISIGQRSKGRLIGLVPTMGALHKGHESLIRLATDKADFTVVSIFVNPTQFGPNEDYDHYPRSFDEDLRICEAAGADIVFHPDPSDMYPAGYSTYIEETSISKVLCGISRPQHFRGVTTVCNKLFNLVRPDLAVFGEKDAQQCAVIRKMIEDLHLPIEMMVGETVREEDGLAMSSRNRYLSREQREAACKIYQALSVGKKMADEGVRSVDRVIAEISHHLGESRRLRIIYASVVDAITMQPAREVKPGECRIVIACWVDQVRLIDNILL